MRSICFLDVETVAVRDLEEPVIESPGDAIVKVHCAGLCGSDLHLFHGRETGADVGTIMGHEFVGEVVAVGGQVHEIQCGDRVCSPFTTNCGRCHFCRIGLTSRCEHGELFGWRSEGSGLHGGQAEYVRVPMAESTLLKIPDSISNQLALLMGDNLSTGFYCAEMAGLSARVDAARRPETVVVIGCGTVGLLSIFAAKQLGASKIIAFDLLPGRLKIAEEFGAITVAGEDELSSRVSEATSDRGVDAVMELVGLPNAQQLAMKVLRPGGTMSVVGCHCAPNFAFSPKEAYDKNLVFKTGRCPARYYMQALFSQLASGEFPNLERLITHSFPIEQAVRAYDVFSKRKEDCIKAMIQL